MSAKKRVFDKDLGVELVLDDEDETATDETRTEQNDDGSRGRKRAKFELSQSSSSQKFSASQQSRISNISHQTNYSRVEQAGLARESNLVDVSDGIDIENYEDIDYGDDDDDSDDDQDYNTDNHNEKQSQESKSVCEVLNYEDLDNDYDEEEDLNDSEHDDSEGEISSPKSLAYKFEKEQERRMRKEEKFRRECERNSLEQAKSEERRMNIEDDGKEPEKSAQEKCKFWPNCTAGTDCSYYHPTKQCRTFPNCRFGKKCLYIHPPCKFNPCTRPGCLFAHPTVTSSSRRNTMHPEAAQQPLAPRCKYGFNCMNLMCKFSHQRSEPCRFGANCLLDTCAYTHPSDVVRKKPTNAFKWSAQS